MPRPRVYDDDVRTRLLEVASAHVSEHGAAGMSLRGIAAEARTTTAAVYTLFGSREELVTAVVREGFARFGAHLAAVPHDDDPRAHLLALGLAYRASALADPHFYRVLFGGDDETRPAKQLAEPTFAVLRHAVGRVLTDAGAPAEAATAAAIRLWALAHGLVSLELGGHLPGTEEGRAERYRDTLLAQRL